VASTRRPSSFSRISFAPQGSAALKAVASAGVRSRKGRPWSMIAPGAK
jgi:hypothetical protein